MAIVLSEMGVPSRSFQGWQVPIHTDDAHGAARITEIIPDELNARMEEGWVPVITGFQGIVPETGRVTTLGRGGSDTSAVAIAAAVKADRCDIYTDVDGVYTTDPRIDPKAKRLNRIAFEEMLEMASLGAKVLMIRSVEMAMAHKVRLVVRSTFDDPDAPQIAPDGTPGVPGTLVCDEDEIMEKQIVSGVTLAKAEAKITLRDVKDRPGVAAAVFGALADESIVVDMIVQNISEDGSVTDITFTVPDSEYDKSVHADRGRQSVRTHRLRPDQRVEGRRQGVRRRRRHAQPCGRRRQHVQGFGRQGHQHPADHHVGNQDLGVDRRRICRACGSGPPYVLRAGQAGRLTQHPPGVN